MSLRAFAQPTLYFTRKGTVSALPLAVCKPVPLALLVDDQMFWYF